MAAIIVVFLIAGWVAISNVQGVLLAIVNVYALILIIILLGTGLIALPRFCLRMAYPYEELKAMYFHAFEAEDGLEHAKLEMRTTVALIGMFCDKVPASARIQSQIDEVQSKISDFYRQAAGSGLAIDDSELPDIDAAGGFEAALASLHSRLIWAASSLRTEELQWKAMLLRARFLHHFTHEPDTPVFGSLLHQLRWRWEFEWKLQAWKVLAGICALLSMLVLWDQVQVPLPLDVSIFSLFIRAAAGSSGVTGATIMASLPLAYMCIAMYFAVFQFKSVNAIALHGSQNTNAYALLYNG